jgi:hypothetical protein
VLTMTCSPKVIPHWMARPLSRFLALDQKIWAPLSPSAMVLGQQVRCAQECS